MTWEDNRKLVYGVLAAFGVLLIVGPSFRDGRPGVIRFIRGTESEYTRLESSRQRNTDQLKQYYGHSVPITFESSRIAEANSELGQDFAELRNRIAFIPPMPYWAVAREECPVPTDVPDREFWFLRVQAREHQTNLLRYVSLQHVGVRDNQFGMDMRGTSPPSDRLPILLRRLAIIDDLVRRAVDSGVRSIDRVEPLEPFKSGPAEGEAFLQLYPVRMEITAPFEAITKFIASLEGLHGEIAEIEETKVATKATVTNAQRRQDAGNEIIITVNVGRQDGLTDDHVLRIYDPHPPENERGFRGRAQVFEVFESSARARMMIEDGWEAAGAVTEGDIARVRETIVQINLGKNQGVTPSHAFTIFDEEPDNIDDLRYKGRAYVKNIEDDKCVAVIPEHALPPVGREEREKRAIGKGDRATTGFYTLLDMRIHATPPRDENRLANEVKATLTMAAVGLMEGATGTATTRTESTAAPRTQTQPPARFRGGY